MKTINNHCCRLLAVGCWLAAQAVQAQDPSAASQKLYTASHMVGLGTTQVLDTYLSAEHFSGPGLSFVSTVESQKPGRQWATLVEHEANLSATQDRAGSQDQLEGAYNFYWGRLRGWTLLDGRLTLQAGGLANVSLGFIYNTSNSNNPAQARAHLNLMPAGVASYRFTLWGHPLKARYELSLPLCGLMFSPNYGQSYYEIFSRGNYDHNAVLTTFAAAPEWRQMLTVDTPVSRSMTLRVGYLGNMQQYKVNNLRQHVYTHRFLIGLTRRFSILER